jgi:hypothetical protein
LIYLKSRIFVSGFSLKKREGGFDPSNSSVGRADRSFIALGGAGIRWDLLK